MRHIDLSQPQSIHTPRQARLTRHLNGRLHDLAANWPEVVLCDQAQGVVQVRFPGWDTAKLLSELNARGVLAEERDGCLVFHLPPDLAFEDLDRVWGTLFELIPPEYQ